MSDERASSTMAYRRAFGQGIRVLEDAGIPYAVGGGIAAKVYGKRRATHDIDVFVKPEDADRALQAFGEAGFRVEKPPEGWLFKAFKRSVMIDIIFRSAGNVTVDDDVLRLARPVRLWKVEFKALPPEDLLVMKAMATSLAGEPAGFWRHWKDALTLVSRPDLDWGYLLNCATEFYAPRILAVLLVAQSEGVPIPSEVLTELAARAGIAGEQSSR